MKLEIYENQGIARQTQNETFRNAIRNCEEEIQDELANAKIEIQNQLYENEEAFRQANETLKGRFLS